MTPTIKETILIIEKRMLIIMHLQSIKIIIKEATGINSKRNQQMGVTASMIRKTIIVIGMAKMMEHHRLSGTMAQGINTNQKTTRMIMMQIDQTTIDNHVDQL